MKFYAFLLSGLIHCGSCLAQDLELPVKHLPVQEKVVALTFDDGPDEQVQKLMELLAQYDAKATFFVVGKQLEKFPEMAKAAASAGHEIGNHSFSHPRLNEMTDDAARDEIVRTQALIQQLTGKTPSVFRAPYLAYSDHTMKILEEIGLTSINAIRSTSDWDRTTTSKQIIERSLNNIAPGDIILMHSWPPNTLKALPEVLRCLSEKGFRCVTVSEMLELSQN